MKKEVLIVSGRQYDYRNGEDRQVNIGKKKAEAIFKRWKEAGKTIRREYGMGGRVTWVWPE